MKLAYVPPPPHLCLCLCLPLSNARAFTGLHEPPPHESIVLALWTIGPRPGAVPHGPLAARRLVHGLPRTGHLHCAPIPPPADRRVYCPHCAGNHSLRYCRDYVEPIVSSFTARPPRADMKCFLCNKPGHIAAECPQRSGYNGGNSCFNCGERGHYASDCPAGNGGGRGGRKRSRHDRFVEMNDGDDDADDGSYRMPPRRHRSGRYTDLQEASDDDSHYYEVPGHRNTKRARTSYNNHHHHHHSSNSGGARYRHNNSSNSSSSNGSSRRRR
ncbi:hypothetical protein PINS_up012013 [Pythium insidiosum]|nr:hypothetical protein PINS_up012013 [Pythium insidiosum]